MKPLFIKKNGTVSKVSGIIMNLIPSYTMAEYNALTHKPLLWVRTDEEYAQIPSEDVSYGSGSVKDALDGLNSDKLLYVDTSISGLAITTENSNTGLYYGIKDLTAVIPEGYNIVSAITISNFDCYILIPNGRRLLVCGTKSVTISSSLQRNIRVWYKKV